MCYNTGRKASIDDAWRNASDVFDEDMEHGSRGEFALLDVADASDDDAGAPRAYGKSLSSLKVTRSRTKEGQSKPFRPGPPVARGMPPPPSAEDAAQLWSHSHGTRLAKSFATGSTRYDGLRRRRGDDYDEDDYDGSSRSGATTRSSTLRAPNGFIGAYSPDARRRRILKYVHVAVD